MTVSSTTARTLALVAALAATVCSAAQVPTGLPLAEGGELRFRLKVAYRVGGLTVGLCDAASSCAYVTVQGVSEDGVGESWSGASVTNCLSDRRVERTVSGSYGWQYGQEVTFVARRAGGSLSVWVEGRPERAAVVALRPGQTEFKFDSEIGSVEVLGMPDRATYGYPLAVGQQVSVLFRGEAGRLAQPTVALCGAARCAQVQLLGVEGDAVGRIVGTVTYNRPGTRWADITEQVTRPSGLPLSEYWVEVARRSEALTEVWLRGRASSWRAQLHTADAELVAWTSTLKPAGSALPRTWASVAIFAA